jgi:hypothetical protein
MSGSIRRFCGLGGHYVVVARSISPGFRKYTSQVAVVRFYNQRATAEQWIKEGKNAVK